MNAQQAPEQFLCATGQRNNVVPLETYLKTQDAPVMLYIGIEALGDGLTIENITERTIQALEKWPDHTLEISTVSMLMYSEMFCGACKQYEGMRSHLMKMTEQLEAMQRKMPRR
jgi:hypothetical protein